MLLRVTGTFINQFRQAEPLLTQLLSVAILDSLEIVPLSTSSAWLLVAEPHLCVGQVLTTGGGRGVRMILAGHPSLRQWRIIVSKLRRSLSLYPNQLAILIVHHKLQLVVLGGVRLEVQIVALA